MFYSDYDGKNLSLNSEYTVFFFIHFFDELELRLTLQKVTVKLL